MIGLQGKTLQSQRLTYRLLNDVDKPALAAFLADEAVTKPAGFLPARDFSAFDAFFEDLKRYDTGIAVLLGDIIIGYIHVNKYRVSAPEFAGKACVATGFIIGKPYQQKGYGAEMLATITQYLLQSFYACFADCFEGNIASQKTIEKCGYQYMESYTMRSAALDEEITCRSYVHL